jgi:hypothetical protein
MAGEFDLGYQLTQELFIVPKDNLAINTILYQKPFQ